MEIVQLALGIFFSVLLGIISYVFKSVLSRIDALERTANVSMSETQIRTLIDDKLAPLYLQNTEIKADIKDIKEKVEKMFDMLWEQSHPTK